MVNDQICDLGAGMMRHFIQDFLRDEDAAVTVDWVVLTAMICTLGIGVTVMMSQTVNDKSKGLGNRIENQALVTYQ